ncbi:MAG: hypothetical protein IT426_19245 [Pirellulales bacterium]|nr:hypothetical protein [Pirellulales bacterium]
MSEYQYIHFMALDKPLSDKQLEYMERQSSRARITRWEFANEYHFGNFHGNAVEMLRRGYDVHLHFANFGIRKLMLRLPAGPPCDRKTLNAFLVEHAVEWIADKKGPGGILCIEPGDDEGFFDYLEGVESLLPKIAPVREMLIEGDLRPLYLAWLACRANLEDDAREPPVPAGLEKLTSPLSALARFYGVAKDLIAAAAEQSPPLADLPKAVDAAKEWLAMRSEKDLRELAEKLLSEDGQTARVETLARIRKETGKTGRPTAKPSRTMGQLIELAKTAGSKRQHNEKLSAEAARRKRLKDIAANPRKLIAYVETLVKMRSTESYKQAAQELADLREAIGPKFGPAQAKAAAEKLRRENPKLKFLISALKKQGLLD